MSKHLDIGEIIIYQPEDKSTHLEVRIEEETVWLSQAQILELFNSTKQNISLHINNIFKEGELIKNAVVKYSLTTASDGKMYKTAYYNLDVIISVGYRVKSQRGTQFRIWANRVLKDYLLKGYVINQRVDKIEKKLLEDESVLTLLSKRGENVSAMIYTTSISKQLALDLKRFNAQYPAIEVVTFTKSHDRFLIIDNSTVYHIGASLKDLGKKWFAFSKINLDAMEIIIKLKTC